MDRSGELRSARVVPVALAILATAFAIRPVDDFDVWFHLAAGRLMWATRAWPATNTFGFTAPDHPWVDLHWLFQLLLYGAYSIGGANGCIALVAVLLLATVAVLYVLARRFVPPASAALLLAVALAVASPRFVPRPEMVSFVLLATYLLVLEGRPRNGRWIYLLVPLQILWTNSQGIFAIGLGLIGCYWLGATLAFLPLPRGWRDASGSPTREWRAFTIVLAVATAAAFLNPYGVAGVLFPLELLPRVTGGSIFTLRIGEFRGPLESGYAPPLTYAWLGLIALTAVSFVLNGRRLHLGRLLAATVFGYLSTQTLRNMALFTWIAVPVIAANLGTLVGRSVPSPRGREPTRPASMAAFRRYAGDRSVRLAANVGTVVVLLALTAAVVTNRFWGALGIEHSFGTGVSPSRFSEDAIAFARDVGIRGRPFNCLALGGFLIWEALPEGQVFVDGRLEAYPESVFREYFQVMDDPSAFPQIGAKYRPDYALIYHIWPNRLSLVRFLAAGRGWTLVYYDEAMSIFLPTDDAHREMRERAQQRFAEILARRRAAPEPARGAWDSVVLPLEELWRQRAFGNLLKAIERYDDAAAAYQRALRIDPDDADVRFNLGLAYWFGAKQTQAVREWRDVLRRKPGYAPAERALRDASRAPSPAT